eukprot:4558098-Pyramimonas_sp.AAC.1
MFRLGSGHRMVEIIEALDVPLEIPESALRKYPFLTTESFVIDQGSPPEMLESGDLRVYIISLVIIVFSGLLGLSGLQVGPIRVFLRVTIIMGVLGMLGIRTLTR